MPLVGVVCAFVLSFCAIQISGIPQYETDFFHLDESEPDTTVVVLEGNKAVLPCNSTAADDLDSVHLLLWYKKGRGTPIYSLDIRPEEKDLHWHDKDVLGSRSHLISEPPQGLIINPVLPSDQGLYRCRVDFINSATINFKINLTVIVAPSNPWIVDSGGVKLKDYSPPYREGQKAKLTCVAKGGRPLPSLSWWLEDKLLDNSWTVDARGKKVTNQLILPELNRSSLHKRLFCTASNNNITPPKIAAIKIEMSLPPLLVEITPKQDVIIAGRSLPVSCIVIGARPATHISWSKNAHPLVHNLATVTEDVNMTTSRLMWTPHANDDGKVLMCQASSVTMENIILRDTWSLNIQFAPLVVVQLGRSLSEDNLREGNDVILQCLIDAKPRVKKVKWMKNKKEIKLRSDHRIITTNTTMVIRKVRFGDSGSYACAAANSQGETTSEYLRIQIKFAPICKTNVNKHYVYGVKEGETVQIVCEIRAYPEPKSIYWSFNNTVERRSIQSTPWNSSYGGSSITYTPKDHLDFGTVLCWSSNDVGNQNSPCIFHIVRAANPEPPHNCSAIRDAFLRVSCSPGDDGGLRQSFVLNVYTHSTKKILLSNLSSDTPSFTVDTKDTAQVLTLVIYAMNLKGVSQAVVLSVNYTTPSARQITDNSRIIPLIPIIGSVVCLLMLAATAWATLMIVRWKRRKKRRKRKRDGIKLSIETLNCSSQSDFSTRNPDVVPTQSESTVVMIEESGLPLITADMPSSMQLRSSNSNNVTDVEASASAEPLSCASLSGSREGTLKRKESSV